MKRTFLPMLALLLCVVLLGLPILSSCDKTPLPEEPQGDSAPITDTDTETLTESDTEDETEPTTDTEPEDTEPENTEPEDTEPENTEPEDTEPENTEPEDTEPENTEPEDTEPENTEPEDTEPEDTEPENTEPENNPPEIKRLKVLAIGNSFSIDGMEYLWNICRDGGYDEVTLGNLYIGGCSLNTHWANISNNSAAYTYYKNTSGTWTQAANVSIATALAQESWDVITIQQASDSSGRASTYGALSDILSYVEENKTNPSARILWHMTWAYAANSTHSGFAHYSNNQATMYGAITSTVQSTVFPHRLIDGVIPSGTAIQNLRSSYVGDTLTRDGYHLSYDLGRYTAALTWYSAITGYSAETIRWIPTAYPAICLDETVIKEAVVNAMRTPYAVTASTHTAKPTYTDADLLRSCGKDPDEYELLDLQMVTNGFYNSTLNYAMVHGVNDRNEPYFNASRHLTRAELPVGSVILVDEGYQYRPEGWINEATKTTSRPGNVKQRLTVVTETWWGSFTIRAFNLSRTTASTVTTAADNAHLRIYVPKASSN